MMSPRLATTALLAGLLACSGVSERLGRGKQSGLDSAAQAESTALASAADTIRRPVIGIAADSTIGWPDLSARVRARPESVRAVLQRHDRQVSVLFLDGRRYHSTEPAIDDIIALLHQVDPSGRILIATE